jgi:hypothetical protein
MTTTPTYLDTPHGLRLEQEGWELGYEIVRVNGFVVGQRRRAEQCGSCGGKMTGADEESDLQGRGLCRLCR